MSPYVDTPVHAVEYIYYALVAVNFRVPHKNYIILSYLVFYINTVSLLYFLKVIFTKSFVKLEFNAL